MKANIRGIEQYNRLIGNSNKNAKYKRCIVKRENSILKKDWNGIGGENSEEQ